MERDKGILSNKVRLEKVEKPDTGQEFGQETESGLQTDAGAVLKSGAETTATDEVEKPEGSGIGAKDIGKPGAVEEAGKADDGAKDAGSRMEKAEGQGGRADAQQPLYAGREMEGSRAKVHPVDGQEGPNVGMPPYGAGNQGQRMGTPPYGAGNQGQDAGAPPYGPGSQGQKAGTPPYGPGQGQKAGTSSYGSGSQGQNMGMPSYGPGNYGQNMAASPGGQQAGYGRGAAPYPGHGYSGPGQQPGGHNGMQGGGPGYPYGQNPYPYFEQGGFEQEMELPMTVGEWLMTMLLMLIPCVNIALVFLWAFGGKEKKSKSNFFKANLIFCGIMFGIFFLGMIFYGFMSLIL